MRARAIRAIRVAETIGTPLFADRAVAESAQARGAR